MGNIPIELLVAGVGVGAVVLIMVCSRWWAGLMLISGMCFFASLGYSQAHFEETGGTILGPLQTTRSVLYLAAGVLVYVSLFLHYQRTPGRYAPQAVALLLIGVYAAVMRVAHGAPLDAAQTLVFVPVTQLGVIMLTSKSLSDPDRWLTVFRWIMVCSVLWTGVVLLQLGINAGAVLRPGPFFTRFQGLTGNPQGAALQLGVTSTIALFLALNETKGRYRLVWPVLTAVNVVLLMWTGSRTGMGMFTIGAAAVLYSRLSRAILLLPVIGIVGIVAFTLVGDTSDIVNTASRLTSTENTRANAWTTLLRLSAENPLTGVGMEKEAREGASENSYLSLRSVGAWVFWSLHCFLRPERCAFGCSRTAAAPPASSGRGLTSSLATTRCTSPAPCLRVTSSPA